MEIINRIACAAPAALLGALFATTAIAAPPNIINVGQKIAQFNVIAKPGGWDPSAGNACNGSRFFFAEDRTGGSPSTLGTITWNGDLSVPGITITDCNGTDGTATVTANEFIDFAVFIRVMGPANSALNLVCETVMPASGENLCLIDTQTFKKGNSFTKVMQTLADQQLYQVLWTLSGNWKIFQVRLFEILP